MEVIPLGPGFAAELRGITLADVASDDAAYAAARAAFEEHSVLVLRNHGVAVCERDIPTTFALLWTVQRAAEIQCQAGALAGEDVMLSDTVQRRCRDVVTDLGMGLRVARLMFDATVRLMRSRSGHGAR